MRPWISKFAKEQDVTSGKNFCSVEYSTELESLIIQGSGERVIDNKDAQVQYTGSYATKSQPDPSSDEPTDR
jgi:hypothetical protein